MKKNREFMIMSYFMSQGRAIDYHAISIPQIHVYMLIYKALQEGLEPTFGESGLEVLKSIYIDEVLYKLPMDEFLTALEEMIAPNVLKVFVGHDVSFEILRKNIERQGLLLLINLDQFSDFKILSLSQRMIDKVLYFEEGHEGFIDAGGSLIDFLLDREIKFEMLGESQAA